MRGVTQVDNQLEVRIPRDAKRDDADLRTAVLQALMLDSLVPSTVDARVASGRVTLSGTAECQFQRQEAEFIVSNVVGVTEIDDAIVLLPPESNTDELERALHNALQRNAGLNAASIRVDRSEGAVTLTGAVRSWGEHDAALATAWAAPGVTSVDDRIRVEY